ncbi:MAG: hypothetical protein I3274_06290 [Candidatus Moeniiplasma glomeromycotorum]|nr:hypothetical protein [Candidatus Moeniiplasma glomeromycotorum]
MKRKTYIIIIATLIGITSGLLFTWLITKVSPKDTWTLTKGVFVSTEKLDEQVPKIDAVDEKMKKSILKKPLNWLSKKMEEQAATAILTGNFNAAVEAIRTYCLLLILIWFIIFLLIWTIFYYLSKWIIGSFIWKEPKTKEFEI